MSHYLQDEQNVGWGPTVEEINHLATLFEEVHHIGCLHSDPAPDSALPYSSDKIKFIPVPPAGGNKLVDKFKILKVTPLYIKTIWEALNTADVVHLRCPANVPLIALLILMLRRKPGFRWAVLEASLLVQRRKKLFCHPGSGLRPHGPFQATEGWKTQENKARLQLAQA